MHKLILFLSLLIALLSIFVSSVGVFWDDGDEPYTYVDVYGDDIEVFGNGIYEKDSYFKAPINKGTDFIILFVVAPMYLITLLYNKKNTLRIKLLNLGLLACLLYYSISLSLGVSYNKFFLAYLLLFSASLFTFIINLIYIDLIELKKGVSEKIPRKSIVIFLVLTGLSVLTLLAEIINSIKTGIPPSNIEPASFILDLGIIAPLAFSTAYLVYKKRPLGYLLSVILLTINAVVGLIVISQNIFQRFYNINLSLEEFVPYVLVFFVMSLFAVYFNIRVLKNINL